MEPLVTASLWIGIVAYLGFAVFCFVNLLRGITGRALMTAALATFIWFATEAAVPAASRLLEAGATVAWLVLLARAIGLDTFAFGSQQGNVATVSVVAILACAFTALVEIAAWMNLASLPVASALGMVVANVGGLVLIEQLARNTVPDHQWRLRYLNIGVGLGFGYNLVQHALGLALANEVASLVALQPAVMALMIPFLIIASLRNRANQLRFNLSREFVFRTSVLAATGVFLLSLSLLGYLAQILSGDIGLTIALFAAIVAASAFVTVISSTRIRNTLRVVLAKTFFAYRYDYRELWLSVTAQLTEESADFDLTQQVQRSLMGLMHAGYSCLWRLDDTGHMTPVSNVSAANWDVRLDSATTQVMVDFFATRNWVLDLRDLPESAAEIGAQLARNRIFDDARFVVPMFVREGLTGIVLVGDSSVLDKLSWEDYDVVKLVSRQGAAFLALEEANQQLIEQEQFTAVNQMSAFLLHDIKTINAQLSLLVDNAEQHKHNPAFIDDMLATTRNSVSRTRRIIEALRDETPLPDDNDKLTNSLDLGATLESWLRDVFPASTRVTLTCDEPVLAAAGTDDVLTPVNHLVQNALEASNDTDMVSITVCRDPNWAYIEVTDTGHGMTREFVASELFKPFSSSKGVSGMGIGAYQARATVRKLGGDITVQSEVGSGSTFSISLPLATSTSGASPQEA